MLQFIRKGLRSWPALALLGAVLLAFIVTGVGDPFSNPIGTRGTVAKVGSRTLVEPDLMTAFDRVLQNARQQNPALTQTELAAQGAVPAVTAQLIGQTALEEFGAKQGLIASDRAIGAVIGSIPAFQSGGKFDDATYRSVLAQQRLTDERLRADIGGDFVRKLLLTPVTAALGVPDGMAAPYARLLLDVHRGSVALVPPAAVAPATAAETEAFYNTNKARFTVPERRGFRYAWIDREAVAAAATVSDAAIAAAYAKDPAKYGAAATRRLLQVVVPDEAKAKAVAAAAKTEGFAKAAERLAGFGAADIAIGEKDQATLASETSAAVAAAAFAIPVGGISAPVKSDFGWHVLQYEAAGAAGKTLEQARPAIVADLKARAGADAVAALVARIEDALEGGSSFADVAKANGLTIISQTPVTREGTTPDAPPLPGDGPALAASAFNRLPEDGAAVDELKAKAPDGSTSPAPGKLVVIETMQVLAAAPRPLAEIRALVAEITTRDKALKRARAKADAVVAAVKKGESFEKAVAAQGLAAPQPLAGRRIDVAQQQQVPPVIQAFLSTAAGQVRVVSGVEGLALVHVAAIEPGNLAAVPGLLEASKRDIASQLPDEFAAAFAMAAQRDVGVSRNEATISDVGRRLAGKDLDAE